MLGSTSYDSILADQRLVYGGAEYLKEGQEMLMDFQVDEH